MADLSIRNDFIEGTYEVFTTLCNDGVNDGVNLYLLSEKTVKSVYGENKVKIYKSPKLLVCLCRKTDSHGNESQEGNKYQAIFDVPLKTLQNAGIDLSDTGLDYLRRCVMEFHGVFYTIESINPKAYVEDVFLIYSFSCIEDIQMKKIIVEEQVGEDEEEQ